MDIEVFWRHQSDRAIWELENVCVMGKCVICKLAHKLGYTVSKGDTIIADNYH